MTKSKKRHIIKKQIFEVEVVGQNKAWDVQQELGEIFQRQILPIISQMLDKYSPSNVIHRIQRLEVDLGEIDVNNLEKAVGQQMVTAFEKALTQALPESNPPLSALIDYLEAPSLGLNPASTQLTEVEQALLLQLKTTFRKLLKEQQLSLDSSDVDGQLSEILLQIDALDLHQGQGHLDSQEKKFITQLKTKFKQLIRSKWTKSNRTTNTSWDKMLQEIDALKLDSEDALSNNLKQILTRKLILTVKTTLQSQNPQTLTEVLQLVNDLNIQLDENLLSDIETKFVQQLKSTLKAQLQKRWKSTSTQSADSSHTEILIYFLETGRLPWWASASSDLLDNTLQQAIIVHPEWLSKRLKIYNSHENYRKRVITSFQDHTLLLISKNYLKPSQSGLTKQLLESLLQELAKIAPKLHLSFTQLRYLFWEMALVGLQESLPSTTFGALFLQNFVLEVAHRSSIKISASEVTQVLKQALNNSKFDSFWQEVSTSSSVTKTPNIDHSSSPPLQKQFSTSDEIYIDNAGLVLIWVFFNNFFKNLDWLEEKTFKTPALQHRATWMLQYLVEGQTNFPEYSLPLNKLLCGLPLQQPLEPLEELTEEEQAAGDALMEAVLGYAKGLGSVSLEGFQQSFLHREGVLTPHNNGYLLQVEKETFDILLNRLEWTYQVIRLPWIDKAIFVEW